MHTKDDNYSLALYLILMKHYTPFYDLYGEASIRRINITLFGIFVARRPFLRKSTKQRRIASSTKTTKYNKKENRHTASEKKKRIVSKKISKMSIGIEILGL